MNVIYELHQLHEKEFVQIRADCIGIKKIRTGWIIRMSDSSKIRIPGVRAYREVKKKIGGRDYGLGIPGKAQ